METFSYFMAKDLSASQGSLSYEVAPHAFINFSKKWSEGMWSRSPTSFIEEAYSSASRLKKVASTSNETEYFDPVQSPWADVGEGLCP